MAGAQDDKLQTELCKTDAVQFCQSTRLKTLVVVPVGISVTERAVAVPTACGKKYACTFKEGGSATQPLLLIPSKWGLPCPQEQHLAFV